MTPSPPRESHALFESLYLDLRQIAASRMARESITPTLQPTALVHEAYLRLSKENRGTWTSRAQFVSATAQAMRRILVERARRRSRVRHGGEWKRVTLHEPALSNGDSLTLSLDEALEELAAIDQRLCDVVQLRFFAGVTLEECAQLLRISPRTVRRDWETARLWLHRRLRERLEVRDVG